MFRPGLYFYNVTLLNADGPLGHALRIKGRRIVAIDAPPHSNDVMVDGRGGLLIPGLINAHDHLELNTFKRLKYREQYTHSLQWIEDIEARFETEADLVEPRRQPLADRLLVGALKNLLSGVTTVCHHNPLHKDLRRHYPIRVVSKYGFCHSLFRGENPATSFQETKPSQPWIIHLAEGIDAAAEAEFEQLDQLGALGENTVVVHGVGLTRAQRQALLKRGGGLVWCPGSNYFMFGQTAEVAELAQAGKVALGSDSRLSGEFDLLSELRVAAESNQLSAQSLFETVTTAAAGVLRLDQGGRGRIDVGGAADLVLLPPLPATDKFAHILDLGRSQLELVMVAGRPLVGSTRMRTVFEATRTKFTGVMVDRVEKLLAEKLGIRLKKSSVQEPGLIL